MYVRTEIGAYRCGVYTHMNRDYKGASGREMEAYGQGYVFINRHNNVYL